MFTMSLINSDFLNSYFFILSSGLHLSQTAYKYQGIHSQPYTLYTKIDPTKIIRRSNSSKMGIFCAVIVCLAIIGIAEPKSQITNEEETGIHKLYTDLEKRFAALELKLANVERESDKSADFLLQNDTNLEERVQALEFQMENVHEDMTVIEGEISVINSEQDLQDTQLQIVEEDVQSATAVTDDLQLSVVSIEENVQTIEVNIEGITGNINELKNITDDLQTSVVSLEETDASLVSRLSELEVDGTFAFHAALGEYTSIPLGSIVVFPIVNVNLGNGYNGETGNYVTPVGGAGLYFFYVHFQVDRGEYTLMDVRLNGVILCQMAENDGQANGVPGGSCGATMILEEGNENIKYSILSAVWLTCVSGLNLKHCVNSPFSCLKFLLHRNFDLVLVMFLLL